MFVMTMNRKNWKRPVLLLACALVLGAAAFVVGGFIGDKAKVANAAVRAGTTGEMEAYFAAKGVTVDLSTARLENGKVPRKFDESFQAFNEVIKAGGGALAKYKNKEVEKWSFTAPGLCYDDQTASAVLLVYKEKVIGCYVLLQPSGEVLSLEGAAARATGAKNAAQNKAANAGAEAPVE